MTVLLTMFVAVAGQGPPPASQPAASAPAAPTSQPADGVIRVELAVPQGVEVQSVSALARRGGKQKQHAGRRNPRTGLYEIGPLPHPGRYDLVVDTGIGRIEGADLDRLRGEFDALIDRPADERPTRPFTDADRAAIRKIVDAIEQFEDFNRILLLAGHGEHATALVEKRRTRPFYRSRNEIIWRIELWYFRWRYGGWEKTPNVEKVLYRQRRPKPEFARLKWNFDASLGGIAIDADGRSPLVRFEVPAKLDPARGPVAQP